MAHAQKPDFVFRRKWRVYLNRRGRQFSRLIAARVVRISGSNTGYTMFRGTVKNTGYPLHLPVPLHFPLRASPCAPTFQLQSTTGTRGQLKYDDTRAETRFLPSVKRTSPFKSAGASVQSTTGSRGVRISGSNAGYTMFRGSVKNTGYPLHSPVPLHFPLRASPCAIIFQLAYCRPIELETLKEQVIFRTTA